MTTSATNLEIDVINTSVRDCNVHFCISPQLWDTFDNTVKSALGSQTWNEAKFCDDAGSAHPDMTALPSDKGGVYVFIAKPLLHPTAHLYLLYVGRAHISDSQNLRKRCLEYTRTQTRPKIRRMIDGWRNYLFIRYLPLTDNTCIDRIEAELINKILPPFNDQIPDQDIRNAVQALI